MLKILFPLIILSVFSCKEKNTFLQKSEKDTIAYEVSNWQDGFGLTHSIDLDSIWGKPVRYYITNSKCDSTALKFYLGVYRPKDEDETERLLSLVTTKNDSLRPFYRWILNKTILIQDGALAEYTGVPARKYAEQFPKEFFEYIDHDQSGGKYSDWSSSISYSGFYDSENYKDIKKINQDMVKTMMKNCTDCNKQYQQKIVSFVNDCFSN